MTLDKLPFSIITFDIEVHFLVVFIRRGNGVTPSSNTKVNCYSRSYTVQPKRSSDCNLLTRPIIILRKNWQHQQCRDYYAASSLSDKWGKDTILNNVEISIIYSIRNYWKLPCRRILFTKHLNNGWLLWLFDLYFLQFVSGCFLTRGDDFAGSRWFCRK